MRKNDFQKGWINKKYSSNIKYITDLNPVKVTLIKFKPYFILL